jgi:methylase of polypeptide subunit release factors
VTSARNDRNSAAVSAHLDALSSRRATSGGVSQRKAQGAHYTPAALVDHLVAEATRGWKPSSPAWRLIDPACGSGNFLVAAARTLAPRLKEPLGKFLARRVYGVDIDPVAVKFARAALLALLPAKTSTTTRTAVKRALAAHIIVHDALSLGFHDAIHGAIHDAVHDATLDGAEKILKTPCDFDLILGNPPFLNQLEKGTAASRARAKEIAQVTNGAVRRYTDLAAAFLVTSLPRLSPRGRLAFVMPQSFLSTGDARTARDAALGCANLHAIWSCNESLFEDAIVRVCAVVLSPAKSRGVRRAFGAEFAPLSLTHRQPKAGDESWSSLLAEGFGAPDVAVVASAPTRTIGDIALATADFRDQYYGLQGAISEGGAIGEGGGPRLVTTKHIDLANCAWGECEVRALGVKYTRPTIDRAKLAPRAKMVAWMESRLVAKILVATQTTVIEAWVDERGEVVPLVPLITVTPRPGVDIWLLAAAIASPIVAARAVAHYAGSALSATAIKLSAKQLMAMPLPSDKRAWTASAKCFKDASRADNPADRARAIQAFAEVSCRAHGLTASEQREMMAFWAKRV